MRIKKTGYSYVVKVVTFEISMIKEVDSVGKDRYLQINFSVSTEGAECHEKDCIKYEMFNIKRIAPYSK